MSERTDLLYRLRELRSNARAHRQMEISARRLIAAGDLAGATTAIDSLELALHPALAAGGGETPTYIEGVALHVGSISPYTGSRVAFNHIRYDPAGWWDADSNQLLSPADIGEHGLYIVSAQVRLDASSAIPDIPEFEIVIGGTLWNYDPVYFELQPAHDTNAYIGSISLPLPISAESSVYLDGYWGGFSQTPSAALAAIFSVFKIGELTP